MGNQDSKLKRNFRSLPAENFPSMRLDPTLQNRSDSDQLDESIGSKPRSRSRSKGIYGSSSRTHSLDNSTDASFLPVYKRHSEVNEFDFKVESLIAYGAFGEVLKVRRRKDNLVYAMKIMQKKKLVAEEAVQQAKDEATIQDSVGHDPRIVKPFWFFQNDVNIYIVMEYISGGELFDAWKQSLHFDETRVKIYIAELALVLEFLHQFGIIYRDLKMENILLDARGHLHITDFGLAKRLKRGQRTRTICGTLQYIAPEVVNGQPYGHSSDWWSLGILMYVMLVGKFPVTGAKDHVDMAQRMAGAMYDLPSSMNFSHECQHLLKQLLQRIPQKRISEVSILKKHRFFDNINFDILNEVQILPNNRHDLNREINYGQSEDNRMFPDFHQRDAHLYRPADSQNKPPPSNLDDFKQNFPAPDLFIQNGEYSRTRDPFRIQNFQNRVFQQENNFQRDQSSHSHINRGLIQTGGMGGALSHDHNERGRALSHDNIARGGPLRDYLKINGVSNNQIHRKEASRDELRNLDRSTWHDANQSTWHDANQGTWHDANQSTWHDANQGTWHDANQGTWHDANQGTWHDASQGNRHDANQGFSYKSPPSQFVQNINQQTRLQDVRQPPSGGHFRQELPKNGLHNRPSRDQIHQPRSTIDQSLRYRSSNNQLRETEHVAISDCFFPANSSHQLNSSKGFDPSSRSINYPIESSRSINDRKNRMIDGRTMNGSNQPYQSQHTQSNVFDFKNISSTSEHQIGRFEDVERTSKIPLQRRKSLHDQVWNRESTPDREMTTSNDRLWYQRSSQNRIVSSSPQPHKYLTLKSRTEKKMAHDFQNLEWENGVSTGSGMFV